MKEQVGTTAKETKTKQLAYANEFRGFLRENPGIVQEAMDLMSKAEAEYNPPNFFIKGLELKWHKKTESWLAIKKDGEISPVDQVIWGRTVYFRPGEVQKSAGGNLEVTILGKQNRIIPEKQGFSLTGRVFHDHIRYFKVKLKGKEFFIKKALAVKNTGFEEFKSTEKAAEILKDMKDVQVIEMQLGYADGNQSWYVSAWGNLESEGFSPVDSIIGRAPNDYGEPMSNFLSFEESSQLVPKLESKVDQIGRKLEQEGLEVVDVYQNLFYNYNTDKYILLDVTSAYAKGLRQPK